MEMDLKKWAKRLGRKGSDVEPKKCNDMPPYDMALLTKDEVRDMRACYDENGEIVPELVTPEVEAAWERIQR